MQFSTSDSSQHIVIQQSNNLQGTAQLSGAKNAVLVIMASTLLTNGKSVLENVPDSHDVQQMILLLQELGACIQFDIHAKRVEIDTQDVNAYKVSPNLMQKMRASVLVMGPLLARFNAVDLALPGGCSLGARPIDFHIKNFKKMGVEFQQHNEFLSGSVHKLQPTNIVLEYPSVGATENILMAATLTIGTTTIINAALEPEILDLIEVLSKMGANITIKAPATLEIVGVKHLKPITHSIIPDRLEAGTLLLATAITGGSIYLPNASSAYLDVFLLKLEEMGHTIIRDTPQGIGLIATKNPKAVSFTTAPYPGFPTDLQAPMMAAQCLARGKSEIHETVFENRFLHINELQKMGAVISVNGSRAVITGVDNLYGTNVIATDIRASSALALAGFAAQGTTTITGIHHWKRGYDALEKKLAQLGACIKIH